MTSLVHFNNFRTTITSGISNSDTSFTLASNIPITLSSQHCYLTLFNNTDYEIVKISSNSGEPTYTIARAQQGSTAQSWASGTRVECRLTKESSDTKQETLSGLAITTATVATDDKVIIQDTSASDVIKTVTAQAIADLAPPSPWSLFDTKTASSSSELTFTSIPDCAFMMFVLIGIVPATTATSLYMQTSTNNGSSYDSGAGNYSYSMFGESATPGDIPDGNNSTTFIRTTLDIKSSGNALAYGRIYLYDPASAEYKYIEGQTVCRSSAGTPLATVQMFSGVRLTAADVDAVRFYMSSGNIASGVIKAYKLSK